MVSDFVEQFGDAEVEQPHLPRRIDQDVRWLDVAMHDQIAVCEAGGIDDLKEQGDAFAQRESAGVAPAQQVLAVDVLHRQPR